MPKKYVRKTDRGSWDAGKMEEAMNAVATADLSVNKAASLYGVPRSTLRRRVKHENKVVTGSSKVGYTA